MKSKRRLTVVIDCETDPFKRGRLVIKPFIWGVYNGDKFRHFATVNAMLNYLMTLGPCVVYAHNGGRFDFLLGLVEYIPNYTALRIVNGRLLSFKIGELEFRDSYSLLPIALREYKKDKFDYRKLERSVRHRYMKQIIKYLRNDCVYLWELVDDFLNKYGAHLTLATSAFKQLVTLEDLDKPKTTYLYFKKFKEFYFGGRVESFADGKQPGPIRVWDINSAYPFAMMEQHPWGGRYVRRSKVPRKVLGGSFIELKAASWGAFPLHDKKIGTYFPNDGKVRTYKITGWEYLAAKDLGLLKKVTVTAYYEFIKHVNFKKYIDTFYELKKAAKDESTDRIFAKLMMNSSYGKLGQDASRFEKYQIAPMGAIKRLSADGWYLRQPLSDGRAIYARPEDREKWRFYDVATAASITGWVRAYLLRAIKRAEKSGSKVFYCDTDCVHIKGKWMPDEGEKLGQWKLEVTFKACWYAGKKLYAGKRYTPKKGKLWKVASKGAKLTGAQVARIAEGHTFAYRQEAPTFSILGKTRLMKRNIRNTNKKKGPLSRPLLRRVRPVAF